MMVAPSDDRRLWLLVRTKPKQERRVEESLFARGIPAFCPRVLEPRLRRWEPKGPVPLFPGYVLAHLVLGEGYAAAQYCAGSAGLVRLGARFAALDDADVETLQSHQGERGYIVVPIRRKEVQPGTRVTVRGGALDGIEGVVTRYLPGPKRVRILLALAWGRCSAEVDAHRVRCA